MEFIKILGKKFKLSLKPGFLSDYRENPDHNWATVHMITQEIVSDPALNDLFESIHHECIHAVSDALGIDLSELQVRLLSEGMYAVLKDNNFLREDIEEYLRGRADQPDWKRMLVKTPDKGNIT